MIPVAALLILLVALFTLAVVINSNAPIELNPNGTFDLSIFGARIAVNELGLFCTGAGVMLVLIIALVFLRAGLRRSRISRRERKNLLNAASGQGKITRKEPSTLVLPGRAGAASSTPGPDGAGGRASDRASGLASDGASGLASDGASGSSPAESTRSGAGTPDAGRSAPDAPRAPSTGTSDNPHGSSDGADSKSSSPRLSVPPMKSPPPQD